MSVTDGVDLPPWLAGGSAAQLFVHGQGHAERALVLARSQDVVCVPEEVDPAYLAFLAGLGLGPRSGRVIAASRFGPTASPERALWARLAGSAEALRALAELLQGAGGACLHPYSASGGERALAAAIEVAADAEVRVAAPEPALVTWADQKHHIRAKAIQLGIPVAEGEVVTLPRANGRRRRDYDALRAAVERHLRHTGQAIVRGAMGASGASTFVVGGRGEDTDGLLRRLSQREDNHVYLVESLVTATISPHVQLHVAPGDGPITCVGVTDQRWERPFVHGGNIYPSSGRHVGAMLDWAGRLARWLQGEGYTGMLGLDFVEYLDPVTGVSRALLAEVHPRVDGATYPLAILQRLNAAQPDGGGTGQSAAFVSGTLELRPTGFAAFRRAAERFFYTARSGSGMVPYQVSRLGEGRCGVVVLGGSREEVLRAYGELQTWCRQGRAAPPGRG